MFLALAFGFFLTAPLVLLISSIVRTGLEVSRGGKKTPDAAAVTAVPAPSARVQMTAPAMLTTPTRPASRLGRRTRPAVAGGNQRDFFGDAVIANRPVTTPAPSTPAPAETAVPMEPSVNGTLLEFPAREAQLARLRQQYAARA